MNQQENNPSEQWEDLPLPDADGAWKKMSLLLDEEDRRRRGLLWWLTRAGVPVMLAAALLVGGLHWFGGADEKKAEKPSSTQPVVAEPKPTTQAQTPSSNTTKNTTTPNEKQTETAVAKTPPLTQKAASNTSASDPIPTVVNLPTSRPAAYLASNRNKPSSAAAAVHPSGRKDAPRQPDLPADEKAVQTLPAPFAATKPAVRDSVAKTAKAPADSVKKDSVAWPAVQPMATATPPKKAQQKRPFTWSAGLALQRTMATSGHDSGGNRMAARGSLRDYIPGVYLRLEKGAWALQAEAFYANPQPVRPFLFSQRTAYDGSALALNTERRVVQKLYYHQFFLSLNRELLPHWTVGVGGVYNRLARTVAERELTRTELQSGTATTTVAQVTAKGYTDSFFYRSTAGLVAQTNYDWKWLSVGLRYTQSLQPFIRYTSPDGAVLDDRNSVLQAALRVRLFGSKR